MMEQKGMKKAATELPPLVGVRGFEPPTTTTPL